MSTLLDECRAAAPAWMAAEGAWLRGVSADQREWMRWERAVWEHAQSGRGWCAEIAVERNAAGWCRVAGVYMPPAPPADADEGIGPEAQGPDLRRALAFVAAEVRAEMVARGLAEAEPDAPGPARAAPLGAARAWRTCRASSRDTTTPACP